ncbi:MAG: hypothetical protein LBL55_03750 [Propionibacteriaceae bacterium]|nr:hypothetical protein [Propionibacteriaceae bacterium]
MTKTVAALTVAAVMALAGCAQGASGPGSAAVVGGAVISEQDVSQTTDAVVRLLRESGLGEPVDHLRSVVVAWTVQSEIVRATEQHFGVVLSEADRQAAAQTQADVQLMLSDPVTRSMVMGPVDLYLLNAMVQAGQFPGDAAQLADFIQSVAVEINPRYGVWLPQELAVSGMAGGVVGSLSDPLTEA